MICLALSQRRDVDHDSSSPTNTPSRLATTTGSQTLGHASASNRRLTRQMLSTFTIVAAVGMIVCGCGSSDKRSTAPSATTSPSTPTAAAVLDTSAYKVSVSGVDRSSSPRLTATAGTEAPPRLPDFLTGSSPGVNVAFGNGEQPSAPLTLTFDFRGKPSPPTAGQVPAVLAVSEGVPEPEVLASHWDPDTQTLTPRQVMLADSSQSRWTSIGSIIRSQTGSTDISVFRPPNLTVSDNP